MTKLSECCQLHERYNIYYVVDGWIAQLTVQDDAYVALEAKGASVEQALVNLRQKLLDGDHNLQTIRKLPRDVNPRY